MTRGPIAISCPSPTDDPDQLHYRFQARADKVLLDIAGQLNNEQHHADTTFANHVIIVFDLDQVALEFGVPVYCLLRACTKAMSTGLVPVTCSITSDHTLRCLLKPTCVARPSDSSESSDRSDLGLHPTDLTCRDAEGKKL